ncbi:hypothetical protein SAMN05216387_11444 [Nitrosovibrio tenuis]|uniref:Uncharacterized protein n=1 Tax=Nitrosovibrio tenuis TaxID=1233 RepID=A0A1H7R1J4_9PROT|nr:hypothetical protein SAMN05216387_11444 [Nitrosovibrio tenuis]
MTEKRKHIPNPEGRPKLMQDGKRRNIYIDEASWQKAKELGNGKPSEGIRKALNSACCDPNPLLTPA